MYRVKEIFTFQIKIHLNKWLICAILTRMHVHAAKTCPIYSPNSNTEKLREQIFTADAIPCMLFFCHQAIKIINLIQNIDFVYEKSFFYYRYLEDKDSLNVNLSQFIWIYISWLQNLCT